MKTQIQKLHTPRHILSAIMTPTLFYMEIGVRLLQYYGLRAAVLRVANVTRNYVKLTPIKNLNNETTSDRRKKNKLHTRKLWGSLLNYTIYISRVCGSAK